MKKRKFSIALLCGGPSPERGISLNSARSVCDHVHSDKIDITPIYFDFKKRAYQISRPQLYSSTPSDFDFKLHQTAVPLSERALIRALNKADLAFPVMHGAFGEDGEIQSLLEKHKIPFVGPGAIACRTAFDKVTAAEFISRQGFFTIPKLVLTPSTRNLRKTIAQYLKEQSNTEYGGAGRFVVKPAMGGSSIGVSSVYTTSEAEQAVRGLFAERSDKRVIIEPFCRGTEFTVIILENRIGVPIALIPTEIELDYGRSDIFDFRRKYLATRQVTYHCPPRFSDQVVDQIQIQAEQLFRLFGMRDFSRFDGWILSNGRILFSDFNPISGMEQNSFLFIQAARLGMGHRDVLSYILKNAAQRYGLSLPAEQSAGRSQRKAVNVIFGGSTAERQVSLMSGTNVWLKLTRSEKYDPYPHILDFKDRVWRLPYAFTLNHTVEEILTMCQHARRDEPRLKKLRERARQRLLLSQEDAQQDWWIPRPITLKDFIKNSPCVFLALHGGIGEDGTMQKMLERNSVPYNGPNSKASHTCMDKYVTGQMLAGLESQGIFVAPKKKVSVQVFRRFSNSDFKEYWDALTQELEAETVVVKPIGDGCSAGIARLYGASDLKTYVHLALEGAPAIQSKTLTHQHGIIEMPTVKMRTLMFEKFIATDRVGVVGNKLKWQARSGWIEVTVAILQEHGRIRALSPSITVAQGNVLSLEEKFQGGTGINITPPPQPYVSPLAVERTKQRVELVAKALNLEGYSRIDCFMHRKTGAITVIEVNTLPGLSPATVTYHQALAEKRPLYPTQFLEKLVDYAFERG